MAADAETLYTARINLCKLFTGNTLSRYKKKQLNVATVFVFPKFAKVLRLLCFIGIIEKYCVGYFYDLYKVIEIDFNLGMMAYEHTKKTLIKYEL